MQVSSLRVLGAGFGSNASLKFSSMRAKAPEQTLETFGMRASDNVSCVWDLQVTMQCEKVSASSCIYSLLAKALGAARRTRT